MPIDLHNAKDRARELCEAFTLEDIAPKPFRPIPLGKDKQKVFVNRIKTFRRMQEGEKIYDPFDDAFKERPQKVWSGEYSCPVSMSSRILECQCPLELDTYGAYCGFNCIYCFTQYTIQSRLSGSLDGWKTTSISSANPTKVMNTLRDYINGKKRWEDREEQDLSLELADDEDPDQTTMDKWSYMRSRIIPEYVIAKAFENRVILKMGVRNDAFQPIEKEKQVSLLALRILYDLDYPVVINTKSDLILQEPYFRTITNFGDKISILETITTSSDELSRQVEVGAPTSSKRFAVCKAFNDVGIRAIPRCEPPLVYLNDSNADKDMEAYLDKAVNANCKFVLSDTYSATVCGDTIREGFLDKGLDFDRMYYTQAEYQELGAVFQAKLHFMAEKKGILWNPSYIFQLLFLHDNEMCCGVEDKANYNHFNLYTAGREILHSSGKTSFKDFEFKARPFSVWARPRLKEIWNELRPFAWRLENVTGVRPYGIDGEGNLIYERNFEDSTFFNTLEFLNELRK